MKFTLTLGDFHSHQEAVEQSKKFSFDNQSIVEHRPTRHLIVGSIEASGMADLELKLDNTFKTMLFSPMTHDWYFRKLTANGFAPEDLTIEVYQEQMSALKTIRGIWADDEGDLHRTTGPAIYVVTNDKIDREAWYIHGNKVKSLKTLLKNPGIIAEYMEKEPQWELVLSSLLESGAIKNEALKENLKILKV